MVNERVLCYNEKQVCIRGEKEDVVLWQFGEQHYGITKEKRKRRDNMTENTEEAVNVAYRKRRVRRIKRIIVGTCITLLILPTILTIILMIKVFSLEKEVAQLQAGRLKTEQQMAEQKEAAKTPEATAVPGRKKYI